MNLLLLVSKLLPVVIDAAAFGINNRAQSFSEIVVGTFNDTLVTANIGSATAFDAADRAFVVGNGTADAARSNALVVYKNGNIIAGDTATASNDTLFANVGVFSSLPGVMAGMIGDSLWVGNKIVLGTSTASGDSSVALGARATASGTASAAFGDRTTASGDFSAAFGDRTTASGSRSAAFGFLTTASGIASAAFGDNTNASGTAATAFGDRTIASGNNAAAFWFRNYCQCFCCCCFWFFD